MLLIVSLTLFPGLSTKAQFFNSSHVPEAVKIAFHQQYPKAKHVNWTKQEIGYQASFQSRRKTLYVLYDNTGNPLAEIVEINKVNLPRRARRQLRNNYTSYAIENVIRIRSGDGKIMYGTHMGGVEEALDVVFNSSGFIVSIVPEETFVSED